MPKFFAAKAASSFLAVAGANQMPFHLAFAAYQGIVVQLPDSADRPADFNFFCAREFEPSPDWHPDDGRSNAAFTLADINGFHVLYFRVEACQSSPEFCIFNRVLYSN